MKPKLKLLLVDFDGVMSTSRFYYSEDEAVQVIVSRARSIIFGPLTKGLVKAWMRGEYTYQDIHAIVEQRSGISAHKLNELLHASIKRFSFNDQMLALISDLRKQNIKVVLFTDNMDIFDTSIRHYHKLDTHFDQIYSSSEHGMLKFEDEKLLQKVLKEMGIAKQHTALVDDSRDSHDAASRYNLKAFLYENYTDSQSLFESWLQEHFTV